ncbi:MAG TPA: MBL fold metallo-hydrolase [Candidatus Eisenbacteria bacterium]|nr:MBL fold metallo-hydrolase [Candidatus Eisenbacteria bacterium]
MFYLEMSPLRSALTGLLAALGQEPTARFATVRHDPDLYAEPPGGAVTFWGHACVYIDVRGRGIVTDPVFGRRYSPLNGRRIPSPPPSAYEETRVILISHAHYDHLQPRTLARFPRRATILCPPPSERYVRNLGPRVRVMRVGEEYTIRGASIVAVPADHPGGRYSHTAEADGRALGYVIRTEIGTLYYSGDTDYFPGIETIGRSYKPDLALLNVNAHLRPADALRAAEALGSPPVVPLHLGAYGGRAARRGHRWHREFLEMAGPLALPLAVGQSVILNGSVSGPVVASRPALRLVRDFTA